MRKVQRTLAGRIASAILDAVYPSRCPICGGISDEHEVSPVCGSCWHEITRYEGPSCRICAKPFSSEHASLCGECMKKEPPFKKALCYGAFEGVLREAIHILKFNGAKRLARPLAFFLSEIDLPKVDFIVPVPMSGGALRNRGFSHMLLVSRALSKKTGVLLNSRALWKEKETPSQVGLSATERLVNLKGAFSYRGSLEGKKVLLVDDVITTGATVRECSKTLLKAGAKEVYVAAIARAKM